MVRVNLMHARFVRSTATDEAFIVVPTKRTWVYLVVSRGPRAISLLGRARKVSPWVAV